MSKKRDKRRKRKEKRRTAEIRQAEGVERARLREAQRRFELLHGGRMPDNNREAPKEHNYEAPTAIVE